MVLENVESPFLIISLKQPSKLQGEHHVRAVYICGLRITEPIYQPFFYFRFFVKSRLFGYKSVHK